MELLFAYLFVNWIIPKKAEIEALHRLLNPPERVQESVPEREPLTCKQHFLLFIGLHLFIILSLLLTIWGLSVC